MNSCTKKPRFDVKIPKAADIKEPIYEGYLLPKPDHVREKIGDESTWFIGMDIETHDFEKSYGIKGNPKSK